MTYPTAVPSMKHDLECTQQLPSEDRTLLSEMGFSNSSELFRKLEEGNPSAPTPLCSVYSYPDGPEYPGPLSRKMIISGVADLSISLIRKIISNEECPDCLHKCTIAVKLADERHFKKLEPRHQTNSLAFAKFLTRLRKEGVAAVLSKDKHGRFGILVPMTNNKQVDSSYAAEDFAAFCYVGDTREVMQYLTEVASSETEKSDVAVSSSGVWQPPGQDNPSETTSLWKPPGGDEEENAPWNSSATDDSAAPWEVNNAGDTESSWGTNLNSLSGNKRGFEEIDGQDKEKGEKGDTFHTDSGAAAADAFYSGLTRSLDTRADSNLFHMRAFNGWVKATQIAELDPKIIIKGRPQPKGPLRVLDLACGKGGDLTKWSLHERGMSTYCGIDVARGSLRDAAIRVRDMRKRNKLTKTKATLICADLGADVPGRKKSPNHRNMQKLLTWSLQEESEFESEQPEFKMVRGGGVSENERFDVVSIQFAIHYMMSSGKRARRFFHTVSELLEVGGNLICTTIDARVVVGHLLNLGLDLHFEKSKHNFESAVVEAGGGACKITFEPEIIKKLIASETDEQKKEEDIFGLQYTFTLVEGSDHQAGVGNAVNLPEWLTPLPMLESLGREAGLELEYAQNFHEFYDERKDPSAHPKAHHALYNMKVLNRNGSISKDEWSVSRLYAAIRFRKVRESSIDLDHEDEPKQEESEDEEEKPVKLDPIKAKKMLPMAMMKAKRLAGEEIWKTLSSDEKKKLTQVELEKLAAQ